MRFGTEVIGHNPVYKRIDISHPGRRRVITREDIENGVCREPDAEAYYREYDSWVLKE